MILAMAALAFSPLQAQACQDRVFASGGQASSCHKAINWTYDSVTGQLHRIERVESKEHPEPQYYHKLLNPCEGANDCESAHDCPLRMRRYNAAYYLVSQGAIVEPELGMDSVCVTPAVSIPTSTLGALAHEEIRKRVSAPTLTAAPPGKTLINIITIYSTPPQPEPRIDISTPVPGSIVAVPEYRWDFGDGLTAVGPGQPYQAGDDPAKLPGKYLGPVWRTGGTKQVTLTVTWRVRFLLEGLVDVPLAPIIFTATEDKQVATARAVLVNR